MIQGTIAAVHTLPAGMVLTAAAAAGATTLTVDSAEVLDTVTPSSLQAGTLTFLGYRADPVTVNLVAPLSSPLGIDTQLLVVGRSITIAEVSVPGEDEPYRAVVPHSLMPMLADGIRGVGEGESVILEEDNRSTGWAIKDLNAVSYQAPPVRRIEDVLPATGAFNGELVDVRNGDGTVTTWAWDADATPAAWQKVTTSDNPGVWQDPSSPAFTRIDEDGLFHSADGLNYDIEATSDGVIVTGGVRTARTGRRWSLTSAESHRLTGYSGATAEITPAGMEVSTTQAPAPGGGVQTSSLVDLISAQVSSNTPPAKLNLYASNGALSPLGRTPTGASLSAENVNVHGNYETRISSGWYLYVDSDVEIKVTAPSIILSGTVTAGDIAATTATFTTKPTVGEVPLAPMSDANTTPSYWFTPATGVTTTAGRLRRTGHVITAYLNLSLPAIAAASTTLSVSLGTLKAYAVPVSPLIATIGDTGGFVGQVSIGQSGAITLLTANKARAAGSGAWLNFAAETSTTL